MDNDIAWKNTCFECNSEDTTLNYYSVDGAGIVLCSNCYNRITNSYSEDRSEFLNESKNYLLGTIGAILFSLAGVVLWVIAACCFDKIAAVVALAIAYLSFKGYTFFKGKPGPLTKWIILIVNIISIVIANVATLIVMLLQEGYSLSYTFTFIRISERAHDFLAKNLKISFGVCIFALVCWLYEIHKATSMPATAITPAKKMM